MLQNNIIVDTKKKTFKKLFVFFTYIYIYNVIMNLWFECQSREETQNFYLFFKTTRVYVCKYERDEIQEKFETINVNNLKEKKNRKIIDNFLAFK